MLSIFKEKELQKIQELQKEIQQLNTKNNKLEQDVEFYQKKISPIIDLENKIIDLENKKKELNIEINNLNTIICDKRNEVLELDKQVIELRNEKLLQDFSFYVPMYNFLTSEEYKNKLDDLRVKQKTMILNETAATCSTKWAINGSVLKGDSQTKKTIKLVLRCFNNECDLLISNVKFNNIYKYRDTIVKTYDKLNLFVSGHDIKISPEYFNLKLEELYLAYEYTLKKQEEKEEQRRVREQLKEELKLQKEIEEKRKELIKEKTHYENALKNISDKILETKDETQLNYLLSRKNELLEHCNKLDNSLKEIDYREANKRAGYVYIISNIGSFGENVFKIGMTRRLDPMDRVNELGDASVPFKFDVHALIFSENAPKLEAALHRAFTNNRVNMINERREFFRCTLKEIEAVVKQNYDKSVDFVYTSEAQQYRETLKIIDNKTNKF